MRKDKSVFLTGKNLLLFLLFLAAFAERTLFDLGPNVELVTAVMVLSALFFGRKESFWLTFLVMVLSDLIIGNSSIFIFTWSGFLIPALLANSLLPGTDDKKIRSALSATGFGVSSNAFFYLWTNFGVWLMSSMYPKTFAGLIMSYINGLPFLKYQLTGTLLFIPSFYALCQIYFLLAKKINISGNKVTADIRN